MILFDCLALFLLNETNLMLVILDGLLILLFRLEINSLFDMNVEISSYILMCSLECECLYFRCTLLMNITLYLCFHCKCHLVIEDIELDRRIKKNAAI